MNPKDIQRILVVFNGTRIIESTPIAPEDGVYNIQDINTIRTIIRELLPLEMLPDVIMEAKKRIRINSAPKEIVAN